MQNNWEKMNIQEKKSYFKDLLKKEDDEKISKIQETYKLTELVENDVKVQVDKSLKELKKVGDRFSRRYSSYEQIKDFKLEEYILYSYILNILDDYFENKKIPYNNKKQLIIDMLNKLE